MNTGTATDQSSHIDHGARLQPDGGRDGYSMALQLGQVGGSTHEGIEHRSQVASFGPWRGHLCRREARHHLGELPRMLLLQPLLHPGSQSGCMTHRIMHGLERLAKTLRIRISVLPIRGQASLKHPTQARYCPVQLRDHRRVQQ